MLSPIRPEAGTFAGRRTRSWPFAAAECGLFLISAAAVCGVLFLGHGALCCDSQNYYDLSQRVLTERSLPADPNNLRTYAFPAVLVLISGGHTLPIQDVHLRLAALQALVLGLLGWISFRLTARAFGRGLAAYTAGFAVAANPILAARAVELLTDFGSAALLSVAALAGFQGSRAQSPRRAATLALAGLSTGVAIMLRPANLVVGGVLVALISLRLWRAGRRVAIIIVACCVVMPFIPQSVVNHRTAGSIDPLRMRGMYRVQAGYGLRTLKYATVIRPGDWRLWYPNPLYDPKAGTPARAIRMRPLAYLGTLALHGFAMLDQDLLFTYSTSLQSWYRRPIAVGNFGLIFLGLVGLALSIRRGFLARAADHAVGWSVMLTGVYLAVYLPTAVESRFAAPLYLLSLPLIVVAVSDLRRTRRVWPILATVMGCVAFVMAACWVSDWLRSLVPRLS